MSNIDIDHERNKMGKADRHKTDVDQHCTSGLKSCKHETCAELVMATKLRKRDAASKEY